MFTHKKVAYSSYKLHVLQISNVLTSQKQTEIKYCFFSESLLFLAFQV